MFQQKNLGTDVKKIFFYSVHNKIWYIVVNKVKKNNDLFLDQTVISYCDDITF